MKDAYSFDADEKGADVSYEKMFKAYTRSSRASAQFPARRGRLGQHRRGLLARVHGPGRHGRRCARLLLGCAYAANLEKAEIAKPEKKQADPRSSSPSRRSTPPTFGRSRRSPPSSA